MPPNPKLQDKDTIDGLLTLHHHHDELSSDEEDVGDHRLRCAILGCGMMGQEHVSYIMGYGEDLRIDFLCDPHEPSVNKCLQVIREHSARAKTSTVQQQPVVLYSEESLLEHVLEIDLLVIATPNYMHADTLLRWAVHDITILLEKPVAVSQAQHDQLAAAADNFQARIWVAMEYRFIPAIAKLIQLLPTVGQIQMVTIRENRFPFLHKIGAWNRDAAKTGDSLVEKCCHFFDLMRLITGQEANLDHVRAMAQRGINYQDEDLPTDMPIIDAAYVFLSFHDAAKHITRKTMACLELCMYADGSRHQEEIIVTGTAGRLEAYLPENKVYAYTRPSQKEWTDRSIPPPSKKEVVHDCSNLQAVHNIDATVNIPTHGGYHYGSTAVEWYRLQEAIKVYDRTGVWKPDVSLHDGLAAVQIGLRATQEIVNEAE